MIGSLVSALARNHAEYSIGLKKIPTAADKDRLTRPRYFLKVLLSLFYYDTSVVYRFLRNGYSSGLHLSLEALSEKERHNIRYGVFVSFYESEFSKGNFSHLPFLRNAAIKSIIFEFQKFHFNFRFECRQILEKYVLANLEIGNLSEVKRALCAGFEGQEGVDDSLLRTVYFQCSGLSEVVEDSFNEYRYPACVEGDLLYAFIKGKSVAIVGPGIGDESNDSEIDGFDIVVRCNFSGSSNGCAGIRTDISYYGSLACSLNFNEIFEAGLLFAVIPSSLYEPVVKENNSFEGIFPRRHNPKVVNGSPNMIPNAVFDILNYRPSVVKVFNSDFYAGKKMYVDGYFLGASMTGLRNLALHDQWSQVVFMKGLYESGRIDVDESCRRILEMDCTEYFDTLADVFGS